MRLPQHLMTDRFNVMGLPGTQAHGEDSTEFVTLFADVPCQMQSQVSEVSEGRELRKEYCWFLDSEVYEAIKIQDRIVYGGRNYVITGRQNLCHRGIYKLELLEAF